MLKNSSVLGTDVYFAGAGMSEETVQFLAEQAEIYPSGR